METQVTKLSNLAGLPPVAGHQGGVPAGYRGVSAQSLEPRRCLHQLLLHQLDHPEVHILLPSSSGVGRGAAPLYSPRPVANLRPLPHLRGALWGGHGLELPEDCTDS